MARIPRFQESGLISADVPRLDFANVREEAKGYESLSSGLDKLAEFAFGKVEKERKEANKILGIQLRADMELEVQKEIDRLSGAIDRDELTYEQTQREVQALQGFARGVAAVDIEQASGLMRSISTSGNALLRKMSDIETAKYAADVDVKANQAVRSLGKNLQDVWGLYRNGQMTEEEVLQYEAGARGIMAGVAGQSKDAIKKYLDADGAFEKARVAARNNTMTTYFTTSDFATRPSDALTKLRSGDAGVFTPVWGQLDDIERDKIVQTMLKRQADDLTIIDRDNKLSIERNRAANYDDYNQFYRGSIGGDELLKRMSARGYIPGREELKQIREGDIPGAPDQYFGALEFRAKQGQMSLYQANELFEQRRISLKQRNGLFGIIDKTENQSESRAKEKIRNAFVPNPNDTSAREGPKRRAEVESHLLGMMAVAQRDGVPFDIEATADILIEARKKQADFINLEDNRERLRKKLEEIGLEYREDYTMDTLRRSNKGNANQHKTIDRLVKSINEKK